MGSRFNPRDYTSNAVVIDDIETILETSLKDSLGISHREYKVPLQPGRGPYNVCIEPHSKDYSVVLVIPDYYERPYVRDMVQLLLVRMGFKQLCVQQVLFCFLL
jgi:actin-related protein 8